MSEIKTSKNGRKYEVKHCDHCNNTYSKFLRNEQKIMEVEQKNIEEKPIEEKKKRGRKKKDESKFEIKKNPQPIEIN